VAAIVAARLRAYQCQAHQQHTIPPFGVAATFSIGSPVVEPEVPRLSLRTLHADTPCAPWLSDTITATRWDTVLVAQMSPAVLKSQILSLYAQHPTHTLTITLPPLTSHEILSLRQQTPS